MDANNRIKFRNYTPQTKFLEGMYIVEKAEPDTLTPLIQDKLDLSKDNAPVSERLEPKKVDWDLKCRLGRSLEKLERETRKCIDKHVKSVRSNAQL